MDYILDALMAAIAIAICMAYSVTMDIIRFTRSY